MNYSPKYIILTILLIVIIIMNLTIQYNTDSFNNLWIIVIVICVIYLFFQDILLGILGLIAGYTMLSNIINVKTPTTTTTIVTSKDECPDTDPILSQFPISLEEEIVKKINNNIITIP